MVGALTYVSLRTRELELEQTEVLQVHVAVAVDVVWLTGLE